MNCVQPAAARLLHDDHAARRRIIARGQPVDVHAACHLFAVRVSTVPVDGIASIRVKPCRLITEINHANKASVYVINRQANIGIGSQVIGYPRLGIKRIRMQ